MATIAVGPAASNRASTTATGNTVLDLANPADGTGTIDTITIYVASQITSAKIGIFYLSSGTTYVCRSSYTTGVLTTGLNTLTGLSLAVQNGDFIGIYHATGGVDRADSGGTSAYVAGEYADAGDSASYTTSGQARIISVHGAGTTAEVGQPTTRRMMNVPGVWGGRGYYG
jgi:hypothetical protein